MTIAIQSPAQAIPTPAPTDLKQQNKNAKLAQRGALGRIVALVINERLSETIYKPSEGLYYLAPIPTSSVKGERFVITGGAPYSTLETKENGDIIPAMMTETDIQLGSYVFQQEIDGAWVDVDSDVHADKFVSVLRKWNDWDVKLTSVFEERIRCSEQYLADTYNLNRPCPTLQDSYITWEQAIVEANGHPLHKCRMPVDPKTQPSQGFNFWKCDIAFLAVKRDILSHFGPLEEELAPLLAAAGISADEADSSEIILPVHEFQVKFLLSLPQGQGKLRQLPQTIPALAQSSTRSMSVPALPGIGIKLSLSLIIGDNIRIINHKSAFSAVQYFEKGMLDSTKVSGLRDSPLEILPEVACVNGLADHLAVMIRWDPYHNSRPPVDDDVGYAVAGALQEPANIGIKGSVAEKVFGLDTVEKRLNFVKEYTSLYFKCFLKPLFENSLLIDAHGQNGIVRFSRSTAQLVGFSARDMSGTRFNKAHFEATTGLVLDERMSNHSLTVDDLLERAYFIFFVVHLGPLIIALDLHRQGAAHFTSAELLSGASADKEAADLAAGNGWAVVARVLHDTLQSYENLEGSDAVSVTSRELAAGARKHWLEQPTWQLQCFISQRMRADWAHRDKGDKDSHIPMPNVIIA